MADAQSLIMLALEEAAAGIPGAGEVMVERAVDIAEDQSAGYVLLELVDFDSVPAGDRIGRSPAGATMKNTVTVSAVVSAIAATAEDVIAFKSNVYAGFGTRIATSKRLRALSHNFRLSRASFFRMIDNDGRPVIRAVCEIVVIYRARANDPATAIQPE